MMARSFSTSWSTDKYRAPEHANVGRVRSGVLTQVNQELNGLLDLLAEALVVRLKSDKVTESQTVRTDSVDENLEGQIAKRIV